MSKSLFSPCSQCSQMLPGFQCIPRRRTRCAKYLEYIQKLNRIRASRILFKELKALIER